MSTHDVALVMAEVSGHLEALSDELMNEDNLHFQEAGKRLKARAVQLMDTALQINIIIDRVDEGLQ